jgi:FkbM family methyltransferase
MTEQFFSEDGCDAWLAQSGLLPESGIYVDAGCAHPWRFSQTAFLRNRGWTGIAIDGDPAYAPEWKGVANAKFVHAVLSDKPTEHFLIEPTNALVSRVHELGKDSPAYNLREICGAHGIRKIDFLTIDIEGSEARVLRDALLLYDIPIIVAEYNSCHKGRDPQVFNAVLCHEMCDERPYRLVHLTDSNAIFVR